MESNKTINFAANKNIAYQPEFSEHKPMGTLRARTINL